MPLVPCQEPHQAYGSPQSACPLIGIEQGSSIIFRNKYGAK